MAKYSVKPLEVESVFGSDEIIVSKTDLKGHLIYANDVFCRVAEMSTADVLGQPHSIIRHPDMPRAVFKFMWERIQSGHEIFAYVKNMAKSGKYYWVLAHVTPSYDSSGKMDGYHSNRRRPDPTAVRTIEAIYKDLLAIEAAHTNAKQGLEASTKALHDKLAELGQSYNEFVWSLVGIK